MEDCNDTDPITYPGAAQLDSATLCMTDIDGDGYGGIAPAFGATPGNDCDDLDGLTYLGAAFNESLFICMTDQDGDGYGDDSPSTGVTLGTDCDDTDPFSTTGSTDGDCDGVLTLVVCDDAYGVCIFQCLG